MDLHDRWFDPEVLDELAVFDWKLLSPDWKETYAAEMRRMALLRHHSTPLNMGVAIDEVAPETRTDFYERKQANGALTPKSGKFSRTAGCCAM